MPDDIQGDVRSFIANHIRSVAQLELLLLLRADPARYWSSDEAARQLYVSADMTDILLGDLKSCRLLSWAAESPDRIRYAPETEELATMVDRLSDLYHLRRVTIISLIHSQPVDKLRSFADAFKLRKNKEN